MVVGLVFKFYDLDKLLGDMIDIGIICVLIFYDIEGLDIGCCYFLFNMLFQNGFVCGNDIFVLLDFIIGGVDMVGKGWCMLMECLFVGCCIILFLIFVGGVKFCVMLMGVYVCICCQFKILIGYMEGVEEMFVCIGGNVYMMDVVICLFIVGVDLGEKFFVILVICKYYLIECFCIVVNDVMDVYGGKGIMFGLNNYLG